MRQTHAPALCLFSAVFLATEVYAEKPSLLLHETFNSEAIPVGWQPGGRKDSLSVVDGSLRGVAMPDDSHEPSIGVPISAHNVSIEFDVQFAKPHGHFLFLVDGESQFRGHAHQLRCAITPKHLQLMLDRGDPASKGTVRK